MLINYNYSEEIDFVQISKDLETSNSIICIENFPESDEKLSNFIKNIGIPIEDFKNNKIKTVFDVKVMKQKGYFKSVANSNYTFPLHTDCADYEKVPNCIGLLCVQPAENNEGANTFVDLESILKQLSESEIELLTTKKWWFRKIYKPILEIDNQTKSIFYDRITMESFTKLDTSEKMILNKLDQIFIQNSFKINLKKGELILFRNDLFLHGRESFEIDSNRLLKRIRFTLINS
ncbi:TauD/TfdA family dioxygenase [Aureivirga sp. CE67]|uniref:TauD/TfdA family dioxygenase n=1 Tax=Aureivirga sp. CE67 TaxID=1788983 RepID=UPI0018CB976E|nr:TauD/TfdA family dioxygenase [Aureivirga sp. CE67]